MKILRLSFRNLNSLRGDFSIDFENGPLGEAGLFAITGQTGAGKTTILDAITLGLFGKAARYDNDRGAPENIMSRGTGECFSEVTFSCGSGSYTARWDLARARKKADGKVQGAKRQIATLDGEILEEKIRQVDERVVSLTGLDYGRFLRSVLLAQGRFKEFLDADSKDRGELLEKITGTEIYSDLSVAAHERARDQQHLIDQARVRLEGIHLLDAEQIRAYGDELKVLEKTYSDCSASLKTKEERVTEIERLRFLVKQCESLKKRSIDWVKNVESFRGSEQSIVLFDQALALSPEYSRWQLLQKRLSEGSERLSLLQSNSDEAKVSIYQVHRRLIASCESERAKLVKEKTLLEESLSKKEKERVALKEWFVENSRDAQLDEILGNVRDKAKACQAARQLLKSHQVAYKGILVRKEKAEQEIVVLSEKRKQGDLVLTDRDKELSTQKRLLEGALNGKEKKEWQGELRREQDFLSQAKLLRSLQNRYAVDTKHLNERSADEKVEAEKEAKLAHRLRVLEKQIADEGKRLKDKETIFRQAEAIASLADRRSKLVDGEPCDLCGAVEHPYALGTLPSPSDAEKECECQANKVTQLEKDEKEVQKLVIQCRERLVALRKEREGVMSRITQLSSEFVELISSVGRDLKIGDQDGLVEWGQTVQENCKRLESSLKEIESNEKSLGEFEKRRMEAASLFVSLGEQLKHCEELYREIGEELKRAESRDGELSQVVKEASVDFFELIKDYAGDDGGHDEMDDLVRRLEKRAKGYLGKLKEQRECEHDLERFRDRVERLEKEEGSLVVERLEWETRLTSLSSDFVESIVVEESVVVERERERRKLSEAAVERETQTRLAYDGKKYELIELRKEFGVVDTELKEAVVKKGFDSIEELVGVLLKKSEVDVMRGRRRELDDEKASIEALKKENEAGLEVLKGKALVSDEELDVLTRTIDEGKDRLKEIGERLGEVKNTLDTDQKARKSRLVEIERIEKIELESKPWIKLRDLIGSADGSKFSRFAQGLTLGQLVIQANRHLRELNPRYLIRRVENSDLELEIVDCYEANTVRPTRSLSGGESFLVSLGLALGLSELAGRNTKIESLFIDEGFGSLDGDTLDVALSALEGLRMQNRSIGIISHVEDLKLRVGMQIQVRRKLNGHSELTVSTSK